MQEHNRYDSKAVRSVRQSGGSDTGMQAISETVDMVYCAECGREYNRLAQTCNHDGTFTYKE